MEGMQRIEKNEDTFVDPEALEPDPDVLTAEQELDVEGGAL